jgi:hypothetical protein
MVILLACEILLGMSVVSADPSTALYVIEDIGGVVETRSLVRLSFDREKKLVKETLLTKDQRFFGHFGGHRLALDRYLVTSYCGIIDIQTCKVINDEQNGSLLGIEGGKVFYRYPASGYHFDTSGQVFSYDLNEGKLEKVKAGGYWDLPGTISPHKSMSVTQESKQVLLHQAGKEPRELAEDFGYTQSMLASLASYVRPLWLDARTS